MKSKDGFTVSYNPQTVVDTEILVIQINTPVNTVLIAINVIEAGRKIGEKLISAKIV